MKLPEAGTLLGGPECCDKMEYPYCTRMCLDEDALRLLGIIDLPEVGTEVVIKAKAQVIEENERLSGEETVRRLSLQITDMEVSGMSSEEPSSKMYGEKK